MQSIKNFISLILMICLPLFTWAQIMQVSGEQVPVSFNQTVQQGNNGTLQNNDPPLGSMTDETIGFSNYDFQTNASIMNRLINHGDDRLTAIWTMGLEAPGFADRGTGYNHFDGTSWGDFPDTRIESVRTGWPSIVVTEDETEFIVSHDFAQNTLVSARRVAGETDWTQSTIPTNVSIGHLWPQMAAGRDNYIHLIAITSLNNLYEGVEGHLLYYRSSDAGLTWETTDFILPGLDSTSYRDYRQSDSYKIAANGNTIAIAKFSMWEDVVVFRSDDNGDNWSKSVIYDFPLENYVAGTGYEVDDVPADDFAPSPLAIYSAGNSGNIVIDNDLNLHLFFNSLYVTDENTSDDGLEYFPCTNGIAYWKESMGENSFRIIAGAIDANNNGFIDLDCLPPNFSHRYSGLATAPNAGIDEFNNIFLTYAAVTEDYFSMTALPSFQHYKHIYAIRSTDGGDTWSNPSDLIKETVDPSIIDIVEADFPAIALEVDDQIHVLYQQDFEPGNSINDLDPFGENRMIYLGFDVSDIGLVSSRDILDVRNRLVLNPNPAKHICNLEINPEWGNDAVLTIHDSQGRLLFTEKSLSATRQSTYPLPIRSMDKGIYAIQVIDEVNHYVSKLVIE